MRPDHFLTALRNAGRELSCELLQLLLWLAFSLPRQQGWRSAFGGGGGEADARPATRPRRPGKGRAARPAYPQAA